MTRLIADAGSLTIKKEPKTKRSYGKRKAVNVPELLAVRVEMSSEEAATTNSNQNEILVEAYTEPAPADNVEYDVDNVQVINVYEDMQDWIEHTEDSEANVKVNALTQIHSVVAWFKFDFRWRRVT